MYIDYKGAKIIRNLSDQDIEYAIKKKNVFVLTVVHKTKTKNISGINFPIIYVAAFEYKKTRGEFKCVSFKSTAHDDKFELKKGMNKEKIEKILKKNKNYFFFLQIMPHCKNGKVMPCWNIDHIMRNVQIGGGNYLEFKHSENIESNVQFSKEELLSKLYEILAPESPYSYSENNKQIINKMKNHFDSQNGHDISQAVLEILEAMNLVNISTNDVNEPLYNIVENNNPLAAASIALQHNPPTVIEIRNSQPSIHIDLTPDDLWLLS